MFKVNEFPAMSLTESGQVNPIRWAIVQRDGDVLTPLSAWFKCKDYFNDVVAAKNGIFFEKYGFDNTNVVVKGEEGLWVYVKDIYHMPTFRKNVAAVTNPDHLVALTRMTATTALLFIPEYYFVNTYRISLLTYLIRLGNMPKSEAVIFESTHQALGTTEAIISPGLTPQGRDFAQQWGWDAREGDKYWWRFSKFTNKSTWDDNYRGYIHNCGVSNWSINNAEKTNAL